MRAVESVCVFLRLGHVKNADPLCSFILNCVDEDVSISTFNNVKQNSMQRLLRFVG